MTRNRWIDAGLATLAEEGAPALRIDRVAMRVGLSKGSFFHHFDSAAAYRAALVAAWEAKAEGEDSPQPPEAQLTALAEEVGDRFDVPLERAMRAWALQEPEVAASVERVDRARLAALEGIWSRLVDDPARARAAALLPHLVAIGASVAFPSPSRRDLEDVFALLADLVPVVRDERATDTTKGTGR